MKKIKILFMIIPILFIISIAVNAAEADGIIKIHAEYYNKPISGIEITIYQVAEAYYENGILKYMPAEGFKDAFNENTFNSFTADPNSMINELTRYITSNQVTITLSGTTDRYGTVEFDDIESGIYIVIQRRQILPIGNNYIYDMQSFTIPIPYIENDGFHNSIVMAYPKISPKTADLILTKQVTATNAPDIEFEFSIMFTNPDNEVINDTILNSQNRFTGTTVKIKSGESITFKNIPLGTKYSICEINLPEGFSLISLTKNGTGTISTILTHELTARNSYSYGITYPSGELDTPETEPGYEQDIIEDPQEPEPQPSPVPEPDELPIEVIERPIPDEPPEYQPETSEPPVDSIGLLTEESRQTPEAAQTNDPFVIGFIIFCASMALIIINQNKKYT